MPGALSTLLNIALIGLAAFCLAACEPRASKQAALSDVSQTHLNDIAKLLNGRSRKTLGWQTPEEALTKEMHLYAQRVALDS